MKTPCQKAARSLPSCPPIFAKCVPFASENFPWKQNLQSIGFMHLSCRVIMLKDRSKLCSAREKSGSKFISTAIANCLNGARGARTDPLGGVIDLRFGDSQSAATPYTDGRLLISRRRHSTSFGRPRRGGEKMLDGNPHQLRFPGAIRVRSRACRTRARRPPARKSR